MKRVFLRLGVSLIIILTLNFFLPRLMKSDPFLYVSDDGTGIVIEYTEEQIQQYKAYYGLDKPILQQYADYLKNAFTGDLGYSIQYNKPVSQIIAERAVWTIGIVSASMLLSVFLGVLLGSFSAYHREDPVDRLLFALNISVSQIPGFIVGTLILILFYTVFAGTFPMAGGFSPFKEIGFNMESISDLARHAALPVMTLVFLRAPDYYLLSRAAMLSELDELYVLTAKAKGLSKAKIVYKHCLINAKDPIIARLFMSLGNMLGGALIVENIFNYPGLGKLMREAVFFRDYALIQGLFFITAILVLTFSQVSELIYSRRV